MAETTGLRFARKRSFDRVESFRHPMGKPFGDRIISGPELRAQSVKNTQVVKWMNLACDHVGQ